MASFEEILSKPTSEIKAPQPFPPGHYTCIVDGLPEHGQSSQKQTDYLRFKYRIVGLGDDVDARAATELQVMGKILTQDHYITDNEVTQHMFREFLEQTLGIENPEGTRSIKEMIPEVPNRQLVVELKHEPSRDGKRTYHRVNSTAHA
jgi:Protein of unknown function (DUF669)